MNKLLKKVITKAPSFLKKLIISFAIIYLVMCSLLYFNQDSFLYHPPDNEYSECQEFTKSEIQTIGTAKVYSNINVTGAPNNSTILIYYHGNGESACDNSLWKSVAIENNMSFMIVEFPGYGGDSRHTNKETILEDADSIARVLLNKPHIIIGRSIGNGPATYLASLTSPKRIILISPYDKLQNVVWSKYIPGFLLKDNFEPITYLKSYNGPVYVFAAEDDIVVPAKFSKRINATKFELVPDANHNTILQLDYNNILKAILTE